MPRALEKEVTLEAQKLVAAWAGYSSADDIEPTSTYGIRTYYNGSVLETHVDRVETHILSVVYCVDRKHNKPWLMETDPDLLGNNAKVDIPPGKLFFYESAKLSHGRPTVLDGEYYAHMFIHYRPVGWTYKNADRYS
jgi:prolyl 4-hydroxylase